MHYSAVVQTQIEQSQLHEMPETFSFSAFLLTVGHWPSRPPYITAKDHGSVRWQPDSGWEDLSFNVNIMTLNC